MVAGWPVWLAWLLPLTVDAYGMTATRVWLAESTRSARARRFARTNAVGAIGLSLVGNAVYHLIAARLVAANWVVIVAVGAIPALVLGLVSHLAVLRTRVDVVRPVERSTGLVRAGDGPRYRRDDQLLAAAREADAVYRASRGRPLSRDALRRELRISGARGTTLVRLLKQERPAGSEVRRDAKIAGL